MAKLKPLRGAIVCAANSYAATRKPMKYARAGFLAAFPGRRETPHDLMPLEGLPHNQLLRAYYEWEQGYAAGQRVREKALEMARG